MRTTATTLGKGLIVLIVKYCVSFYCGMQHPTPLSIEWLLTCLFPHIIDVNKWRAALRITHGAVALFINNLLM